jgi:hypothetical protein
MRYPIAKQLLALAQASDVTPSPEGRVRIDHVLPPSVVRTKSSVDPEVRPPVPSMSVTTSAEETIPAQVAAEEQARDLNSPESAIGETVHRCPPSIVEMKTDPPSKTPPPAQVSAPEHESEAEKRKPAGSTRPAQLRPPLWEKYNESSPAGPVSRVDLSFVT